MDFNYFLDPITNHYADFQGATGRKAYWMFVLFSLIIQFVGSAVVFGVLGVLHLGFLGYLVLFAYGVAIFLPSLGITVRRLHDAGLSGFWLLLSAVPLGQLVVLVMLRQPSKAPFGAVAYP